MIDKEHCGTVCRVLLADDVELDVAELPCEAAEQGRGEVDATPTVVGQHPDDRARAHRRSEAAEHARGADQRHRMVLASLAPELQDVPSVLTGVAGQFRPRVDWVRMADGVEEG